MPQSLCSFGVSLYINIVGPGSNPSRFSNPSRLYQKAILILPSTVLKMQISGTIGSTRVLSTLSEKGVEIKKGSKVLHHITSLWLIGLQRVTKHLKTCDVVWVDGATQKTIVQTIAQDDASRILEYARSDAAPCVAYLLGMDPPLWSKISATARKHDWKSEDWNHVFAEEGTESDVEMSGSDGEWLPCGDEDESDSDETSDEDEQ